MTTTTDPQSQTQGAQTPAATEPPSAVQLREPTTPASAVDAMPWSDCPRGPLCPAYATGTFCPDCKKAKRRAPTLDETRAAEALKKDPVAEVFRVELLRVLGDDQPSLNAKTLNLIIQIATAARDILSLRNPRSRQRCGPQFAYGWGGGIANPVYVGTTEDDDGLGPAETIPPPPLNPINNMDRETFGAKLVRELVATIPEIARAARENPVDLVKAIAAAREANMPDVVAELEAKLLGHASATPTPTNGVHVQPLRQTEAGMRGEVTEVTERIPTP